MMVNKQPRIKNNKTKFSPTFVHDEFIREVECVVLGVCIERISDIVFDLE
jgi:hypothetical protein